MMIKCSQMIVDLTKIDTMISKKNTCSTKILGFSNGPSWLIDHCLLMDMSILTKGSRHVFFDQSTWLKWLIWLIHPIKLHNLNQNV